MKTNITTAGFFAAAFFISSSLQAQADLSIGNIDAGWDTYNSGTGIITGVYFDVLNNEDDAASGSFDITVYLIDPNDNNITYAVHVITDPNGQNGNTVVTYENIDINFNDTENIPAGEYRLGVCVDSDEDVSETDEGNNCLFISTSGNNLTYSPNTMSLSTEAKDNGIDVYPNPAQDKVNFVQAKGWENASVLLMDASGKVVMSRAMNIQLTEMDLSGLSTGLYFYQVVAKDGNILGSGKLIKE